MPDPRDNYDPAAMEKKLQKAIAAGVIAKKAKVKKKLSQAQQVKIARRLGA